MKKTIANLILVIHSACPLAVLAVLLFLAPTEAQALKISAEMTPDSLQQSGFSMQVENRKAGTVEFTLSRDLSKARSFGPDSDLRVSRSATLKVFGKSGLVADCEGEPEERKSTLTYRFVIARDCVPDSHFTLAEIDDYKDKTREHLIGGGTIYEFRLAIFAAHPSREKKP
jgi:hypothetical protein